MTHVFVKVTYEVFNIQGFFTELKKFLGHFQIEQTIGESHIGVFRMWFWTDKVEIKEGEIRQVDILCHYEKEYPLRFEIKKWD